MKKLKPLQGLGIVSDGPTCKYLKGCDNYPRYRVFPGGVLVCKVHLPVVPQEYVAFEEVR